MTRGRVHAPVQGRERWHKACACEVGRHDPCALPYCTGLGPAGDPVVPYHTIAFSQQKLRAAIRRAAGQDPAFSYGFVVHSRRYSARPTLGLITLNGESLELSERLLKSLEGSPLWLFGHARITLAVGTVAEGAEGGEEDGDLQPLSSLLMHIATFDASAGVTQHLVQVEAQVKAETLVQPLLVLTHTRPESWPL
jgi:hypothetical protein